MVAVIRYGGYSNPEVMMEKLRELKRLCAGDGLLPSAEADAVYEYCGYGKPHIDENSYIRRAQGIHGLSTAILRVL